MSPLLILALTYSITAASADSMPPLANFQSGSYKLTSGELSQCGEGDFYLRDGNANVAFADFHGFNTVSNTTTLKGDAPGDENCTYRGEDKVDASGSETHLTFSEERKCKNVSKHILIKTALVHKDSITMNVHQSGSDGKINYTCVWKLNSEPKRP